MRLFADIQNKGLLHAKGILFLFVGLLAATAILLESPRVQTALLLLIAIWAFCRFYYYLFYVLENYAGRTRKYAGVFDAVKFILTPKNRRSSRD